MKKVKRNHIEAARFWVEENEKGLSKTEVAKLFNSDRHQISKLKDSYQEYVESARPEDKDYLFLFSDLEKKAIQEYHNNTKSSKREVCKKYNIGNNRTLDNWLEICGYSAERHYIYSYDRTVFAGPITEESAYWIGFLLADGYIGRRNNQRSVELKLGAKDKEHLVKFARFVGMPEEQIDASIKQGVGGAYSGDNIVYSIGLYSDNMAQDLSRYYIVENKSLKERPYIFDSDSLQLNYIRGIIDGDGYVSLPNRKDKRVGVCGSRAVCQYISDFFSQRYPDIYITPAHLKYTNKEGSELWCWYTTNREATKKVLTDLYKDSSIYLDRKYQNACAVLKSLNKTGTLS